METQKIDLVAYSEEKDLVHLIIMDDQDWDDARAHIDELHEKILSYVAFVENGTYQNKYPEMKDKPVVIDVIFDQEPTKEGQTFLEQIDQVLKDTGYHIEFRNYTSL